MDRDDSFWQRQRARVCLDPENIYLNSGSFSPIPLPVFDRITALRRRLAENPSDFLWRQTPLLLDRARSRLAEYLHADERRLLLLLNATTGINLVVHSLCLPAGSEILTTDHEYGAMMMCWRRFAVRTGAEIVEAPLPHGEDPEEIVEAFRRAITPQTRVLYFSHVTSPTGLVLPAKPLCELAREHEVLSIVDGAHAPGMLPLDLPEIGADFYAGNCHKWMMAPTGAGFLYAPGADRFPLESLTTSWGWEYDRAIADEDSQWGGSFWARDLEFQGTADRTPLMALPEVLDFRDELGEPAVFERVRRLAEYARERFLEIGYGPVTPWSAELSGALTAFRVPTVDPVKARDWLHDVHRMEAPFTTAAGRTHLRVSTAWFNTTEEIDALAAAMTEFQPDKLQ